MAPNESSTDADVNRRTVLQTAGATGIGMIGIGSLIGIGGAKDPDKDKETCPLATNAISESALPLI
jgi:hypothetical protein